MKVDDEREGAGLDWREATEDGEATVRRVVSAMDWPEMRLHRIARMGFDAAGKGYRRVRVTPQGSFLLACVRGSGRVLLDGRWQRVGPGVVVLAPPRVLNAFETVGDRSWEFYWVRWEEPNYVRSMVGTDSPMRAAQGAGLLGVALEGFLGEWEGTREARVLHHWFELVRVWCDRMCARSGRDFRLAALWQAVEERPDHGWTLETLATRVHMSTEHLRRICRLEQGRTPMDQVTFIRMCLARRLLETHGDKVEYVARMAGYEQASAFTRAFRRWVGVSPSDYRDAQSVRSVGAVD
jgi:AraC-like DNA-binding protein